MGTEHSIWFYTKIKFHFKGETGKVIAMPGLIRSQSTWLNSSSEGSGQHALLPKVGRHVDSHLNLIFKNITYCIFSFKFHPWKNVPDLWSSVSKHWENRALKVQIFKPFFRIVLSRTQYVWLKSVMSQLIKLKLCHHFWWISDEFLLKCRK